MLESLTRSILVVSGSDCAGVFGKLWVWTPFAHFSRLFAKRREIEASLRPIAFAADSLAPRLK
jgi:hypothetical protein